MWTAQSLECPISETSSKFWVSFPGKNVKWRKDDVLFTVLLTWQIHIIWNPYFCLLYWCRDFTHKFSYFELFHWKYAQRTINILTSPGLLLLPSLSQGWRPRRRQRRRRRRRWWWWWWWWRWWWRWWWWLQLLSTGKHRQVLNNKKSNLHKTLSTLEEVPYCSELHLLVEQLRNEVTVVVRDQRKFSAKTVENVRHIQGKLIGTCNAILAVYYDEWPPVQYWRMLVRQRENPIYIFQCILSCVTWIRK